MNNFVSGKIVKEFSSKTNKKIHVRYPIKEDLDQLTEYINKLSKEDTFITFSGEVISRDEEERFLLKEFKDIQNSNAVILCCFIDNRLIAISNIDRDFSHKKRGLHVGIFGISVAKEFRGEGIGFELAKAVIEEVKEKIPGLKMITLVVYGKNDVAQNLYKKLGFKEYGKLPKGLLYKEKYIDEIRMYLEI